MNNWLDKLERKFSRYAIPNLMTYIIILYAAGFVLNLINPTFYSQFLSLDAGKILQGQIWRIVTFIIQPPSDSLIFIVFVFGNALYCNRRHTGIFTDRRCVTDGYMVSESVAILCICGTLPGYPAVIVLCHTDQDKMAGDAGWSVFCVCDRTGFSSGLRRR